MGGIRKKLLIMLIIYCSGFASAVYALAPASQDNKGALENVKNLFQSQRTECNRESRTTDYQEQYADDEQTKITAEMVNSKIEQWLSFAEEKASKVGALVRSKLADSK